MTSCKTTVVQTEKFGGPVGHLAELSTYADGMCVARLKRLGHMKMTEGSWAKTQGGYINVPRFDGMVPDVLYDRFEGPREQAVAFLKEKQFEMGRVCPQCGREVTWRVCITDGEAINCAGWRLPMPEKKK